jgi:hypothetical protein
VSSRCYDFPSRDPWRPKAFGLGLSGMGSPCPLGWPSMFFLGCSSAGFAVFLVGVPTSPVDVPTSPAGVPAFTLGIPVFTVGAPVFTVDNPAFSASVPVFCRPLAVVHVLRGLCFSFNP